MRNSKQSFDLTRRVVVARKSLQILVCGVLTLAVVGSTAAPNAQKKAKARPPVDGQLATAAESLTTLPGFKVELLRSADAGEGSWICMAVDPKGRLIISPQQDDRPMLRLTLDKKGQVALVETIAAGIHQEMGLCWAQDSLYANSHGP